MGTAMSILPEGDKDILVYSAGPSHINTMGMEFTNISERGLKARGIKIKFIKVPPSWIRENISSIGYFAFFSKPKESISDLVTLAENKNIEVGVYRY
jgi:hypothetical protein